MKVTLYTDGAARGNPDGPGGYGAVLQFVDAAGRLHEKELSAGYRKTTNNRMELMAAIVGLEALVKPCQVELYSDSKYSKSCCSPRVLYSFPLQIFNSIIKRFPL